MLGGMTRLLDSHFITCIACGTVKGSPTRPPATHTSICEDCRQALVVARDEERAIWQVDMRD
jgi:hypothetical protein